MIKRLLVLFGLLAVFVVLGLLVGSFKTTPPQSGSEVSESGNIKVYQPVSGETVGQPLVIVGEARVFENAFMYRVMDGEGHQLAGGFDTAHAPDVGTFGGFSLTIDYGYQPNSPEGFVEVYAHSAKDGSEIDLVRIPVHFADEPKTAVNVYFDNQHAKPIGADGLVVGECDGVYRTGRVVPKTTAVARAALEELFKGPTEAEKAAGYTTALNAGIRVNSAVIKDGIATVDLSSELMREVGGSCRIGMISAQIVTTLKQFESVKSVVILVDGQADQLQP